MMRHQSPISGIASDHHLYIATAGYDNRIILWNGIDHSPIAMGHHDHLANQCEFSPCGQYLVTSSSDYTARLWSVPEMKLISIMTDHQDDVESATFHPTLPLIATASRDHYVRVFDFNGKLLKKCIGHTADVISVQWIKESAQLISSSDDGTVRVWDMHSENQIAQLNDTGVETDTIAISHEGVVYAGDDTGHIHIIINNNKQSVSAHQSGIKKIVYHPARKKMISVAYDRKAILWDILSNGKIQRLTEFTLPNIIWARSCAFHNDNEIIFATFGDTYALYNHKTQSWQLDHINDTHGINTISADEDGIWTIGDAGLLKKNEKAEKEFSSLCNFLIRCGDTRLTGGQSGEIFDTVSQEIIYKHYSPLNCATQFIHQNEVYIAIGTYTGEALIFKQGVSGKITHVDTWQLHHNAIKGLASQNHLLFSVCATGAVAWHDIQGNALHTHQDAHDKIANGCVALSNNQFASISRDLTLRIWDGNQFSLSSKIDTPHTHSIKCIATDDSHRYIATASYNGLMAIYDLKNTAWQVKRLTHRGISAICYDKTRHLFLASSYDGMIYTVEVTTC
ncbi:MAG: hypothetical protein SFW66_10070 [Gammaproteobacteria bacterium]|nr:hypothetical protein [Gammaproteobacteria bacterium]